MGLSRVSHWKTSGMLLTGNMKPESRMVGMKMRKVAMKASCCVLEMVEMSSPRPSAESR